MIKSSLKEELLRKIESGSLDVPTRGESGMYGTRNVTPLSHTIKRIKQARTFQELEIAAKGVRTIEDQNAALRKNASLQLASMPANREVCLTFDWHPVFQPEDANVASLCVLEFLLRMAKNTCRSAKLPLDLSAQNFVVVPEIWSSDGRSMPLHFHLLIDVPEGGLAWFDARARSIWEQVLRPNKLMGAIHYAPINDKDRLSRYSLKQFDLEWVFDRTIWPSDLLKYHGTSS